jgi:transcriptional regulator with XRE-family HTH domain
MRKLIIGSIVKTLRERQGLSQAGLAKAANLSKDSLSRLERGKQSGSSLRTREALAKCLNVEPEMLTGEKPMPASEPALADEWLDSRRHQLNIRVDGAVRNAFSLVSLRYRIPVARIAELAPLLFVLAAERSLELRRSRIGTLKEARDRADAAAASFHHLPRSIAPGNQAGDMLAIELNAIANSDILADTIAARIADEVEWSGGHQKYDYDEERDNPFVASLREAATNPVCAEIRSFSRDDVDFQVCRDDAMKLAGGHSELAVGILHGWALVHEMPRELLKDSAIEDRVEWLRGKESEHSAGMAQMLIDLGLDDIGEGTAS